MPLTSPDSLLARLDRLERESRRWKRVALGSWVAIAALHGGLADVALAVRRGPRVLEDAVVGHGRHHAVDVVAGEGVEEAAGPRQGRSGLGVAHASS
jgi:hypothetical protein